MMKLRMSVCWQRVTVVAVVLAAAVVTASWLVSVVCATGVRHVSPEMMIAFARAVGW